MFYGSYKDIRNSAWQCLADFEINSLPVDVLKITRKSNIRVVKNSVVDVLSPCEHGKTYFDGSTWIIVYNDSNSIELSRFTIAHEIGHIFLGHELKYIKYSSSKEFDKTPPAEAEADMFASRLLCPACVLRELDIKNADEISKICKVPYETAKARADRMRELSKRDKFLTSPLEKQVHLLFFREKEK